MSGAYRLTRLFSNLVVLMPTGSLYFLSDCLYILVYYLLRYRRKVVSDNLCNAFPEKTSAELTLIEKKFFKHLCDLIVELLRVPGMSKAQLEERVRFVNPDIFRKYALENQNLIAVTSHNNNWEWGGLALCGVAAQYKILGIYKPINDVGIDDYLRSLRSRFGMELVPMKMTYRAILRHKDLTITSLLSDQTPSTGDTQFVMPFMGRSIPIHLGAEKIARRLNYPVVYLAMRKIRRGYYEVEAIPISNNPGISNEFEITRKHVHLLEEEIRSEPAYWLWSHRRWKHAGKSWPESVVVA